METLLFYGDWSSPSSMRGRPPGPQKAIYAAAVHVLGASQVVKVPEQCTSINCSCCSAATQEVHHYGLSAAQRRRALARDAHFVEQGHPARPLPVVGWRDCMSLRRCVNFTGGVDGIFGSALPCPAAGRLVSRDGNGSLGIGARGMTDVCQLPLPAHWQKSRVKRARPTPRRL